MRLLFFGIYKFGSKALQALHDAGYDIAAVVTKPDQDGARQEVAVLAERLGLPVAAPEKLGDADFVSWLRSLAPDLMVVSGYHKKIPQLVLDVPRNGAINVHAGPLPRYRGPCAWKWAIINGETETALTVHLMTAQLDSGDILTQSFFPIDGAETGGSLFDKFCDHVPKLLLETMERLQNGQVSGDPQEESMASYYSYPTEADACIDWRRESEEICRLVRGLNPRPLAWTSAGGLVVRVEACESLDEKPALPPGTVIAKENGRLVVATADGAVAVLAQEVGNCPCA